MQAIMQWWRTRSMADGRTARERFYEPGRWMWLDRWTRHLTYALRTFRHSPAFALSVIVTLGVGVGLNTAIFTLFYALTARPLPAREPEQLVNVYQQLRGRFSREVHGMNSLVSYPEYRGYARSNAFSAMAAYAEIRLAMPAVSSGSTRGELVSCNYFQTVGAPMALGRAFAPQECARVGGDAVAVLSYESWASDFAGDSAVLGRRILLNALPHTVVGVAAPGFKGLTIEPARVWMPVTMQPALEHGRDSVFVRDASWLMVVGRLATGRSIEQARASLQVAARQRDALYPGRITAVIVNTGALFNFPEAREQGTLIVRFVVALGALIVVIAWANVTGLLLARGLQRRREVGIRLALGASRRRLVEQLVVESMLLALAGGALGFAFMFALPRVIARVSPIPGLQINATPDMRIFLYALAVSVFAALVFGLAPALQSTRLDLASAIRGTSAGGRGRARPSRLREGVISVQVAASALLLVIAALFLRAAQHATSIDPGYLTREVSAISLNLPQLGYDDARARAIQDVVMRRARSLPGVQSVALAEGLPLLSEHTETIEGDAGVAALGDRGTVHVYVVSGSYFQTLGVPLVRGTTFSDAPATGADGAAVVSSSFAQMVWPGADPLGRRIRVGGHWLRITGVSADTRSVTLGSNAQPFVYRNVDEPLYMKILVRGTGKGFDLSALRDAARAVDPSVTLELQRIEERFALALGPARLAATVAGALGTLALLLAAVGVYGVVSYAASQRRREVAVRVALGATPASVVRLMLGQGARAMIAGLVVGLVIAAGASLLLRGLLFGLSPLDPLAFSAMASLLLLAGFAAMYGPARRASVLDPACLLREN